MKPRLILVLLIATDLVLAALLAKGVAQRGVGDVEVASAGESVAAAPSGTRPDPAVAGEPAAEKSRQNPASARSVPVEGSRTTFTVVYAQDGAEFASRLRAIGCPDETVRDILVAEVNRRYAAQERELRPKPADHVPILWSANPSESKLSERRQRAAAIAREKAAVLRTALGYEVPVEMAVYAITTSEQRFQESRQALASEGRAAAIRADEEYWTKAQTVLDRTKGFWLPEDVAELQRLKAERRAALASVGGAQ